MTKLLVLDGNSLAYRAFFALPETLTTPDGQPTNSVYGFTNMLLRMLREREPDHVVVAFDTGVPQSRLALAPEYKANRDEMPSPLRSQFPLIREVLDVLRIPILTADEAEADDILATLARQCVEAGIEIEIVTGDRDMFQLVCDDPPVRVIYTKRGISEVDEMDEAAVEARYGVGPRRYVDLAAMRGDKSDNLEGIPGIGDKTAAKLLNQYGSLDEIIEHVDEFTPKQSENVERYWHRVERNVAVMALDSHVDIGVTLDDLVVGEWDLTQIRHLYQSLDFGAVLDRTFVLADRYAPPGADASTGDGVATVEVSVDHVRDAADLPAMVESLGDEVGVAFEPIGHTRNSADWAFADTDGAAVYCARIGFDRVALETVLGKDGPGFHTHNAKDLIKLLRTNGLKVSGLGIDVEVGAFVVDPSVGKYSLDAVAERTLGIELTNPDRPADQLALGGGEEDIDLSRRAWAAAVLGPKIRAQLESSGQLRLYEDVERPLIGILAAMEDVGVRVDVDYLAELSADLTGRISRLERRIWDHAGREFVVNSTKQLREVLFDELGLAPQKKTKTGYSTDAATLEALADEHPIAECLLEYRNLEKLRSTYTDALPPLVDAHDGRIHTRFKQTGASTGRLSSEHPNLMNIPIRSTEGMRIRRAFVAADGYQLCSADYSQIELRVMAHLSGDQGLIDAFGAGADVHTETAARVFGVAPDEVTSLQRSRAKVVNYGLLYGMQTWGLASRMGIERDEAQAVIDAYFDEFATLRKFMDDLVAQATKDGYTTTLLGRRRYFPELHSRNQRFRQMGERQALNAPIQGTAADIMKVAMVDLDRELSSCRLDARLLLQVHDELVLEVPDDEIDEVGTLVESTMRGAADLAVPLVVDCHFGRDWAATK